jgi:hypothetical protein
MFFMGIWLKLLSGRVLIRGEPERDAENGIQAKKAGASGRDSNSLCITVLLFSFLLCKNTQRHKNDLYSRCDWFSPNPGPQEKVRVESWR